MRLIDADELRKQFSSEEHYWALKIKGIIDNAPTVELTLSLDNISDEDIEKFKMIWQRATGKGLLAQCERPQGEWIDHWDKGYVECPFCNHEITGIPQDLNYCCKCGADMRKEESSNG